MPSVLCAFCQRRNRHTQRSGQSVAHLNIILLVVAEDVDETESSVDCFWEVEWYCCSRGLVTVPSAGGQTSDSWFMMLSSSCRPYVPPETGASAGIAYSLRRSWDCIGCGSAGLRPARPRAPPCHSPRSDYRAAVLVNNASLPAVKSIIVRYGRGTVNAAGLGHFLCLRDVQACRTKEVLAGAMRIHLPVVKAHTLHDTYHSWSFAERP